MGKLIEADIAATPEFNSEEFYEPVVAAQLKADAHYSIIRIRDVQYAFTTYEAHARALGQIWDAGLVPESGPTAVLGADLPEVAPKLQGVDTDLGDLRRSDFEQRRRRFA